MKQTLNATIDDLRLECVLAQAWKKTAAHLRQHSWYADTLELDYQSLRLPDFIREIKQRLQHPDRWRPAPLCLVPAPKAQNWALRNDKWGPEESLQKRMRPLAHVDLQDQVLATAMMMCLADRVETSAGDPRLSIDKSQNRKQMLAYGHRLFCDSTGASQRYRWGTSKLYRLYFQDYQKFLERPKIVAALEKSEGTEIAIARSDLSKFYDRVKPHLLHEKVRALKTAGDDAPFFDLLNCLFNWPWSEDKWAAAYSRIHSIEGFDRIALPQGLAASGFFANVVLRDFEALLRGAFGRPIAGAGSPVLLDGCYYVDDLRLVLRVVKDKPELEIQAEVSDLLQRLLDQSAPGLIVEKDKTKVTVEGREKLFLVQQSQAATRIQKEVSGTFDMLHGTELIGAIEGFFHTQQRYSSSSSAEAAGRSRLLVGISDMRDDTAARFAAGRYRRTFRSLRPLLMEEADRTSGEEATNAEEADSESASQLVLSKEQLDERGHLFAAMLIEEWVHNPGNVRLLRIALDLYPARDFLDRILALLRPGWVPNGARGPAKEVRLYCLSELLRAGATETGMVQDEDCLPKGASLADYHQRLETEAREIFDAHTGNPASAQRFPWYFMQQVFLYLAARNAFPSSYTCPERRRKTNLTRYRRFAAMLNGTLPSSLEDRTIFLVIAQTAFGHEAVLRQFASRQINPELLKHLARVSPEVAVTLWKAMDGQRSSSLLNAAKAIGLDNTSTGKTDSTLASFASRPDNPFFEEENLLRLADELLDIPCAQWPSELTPWQINCHLDDLPGGCHFGRLKKGSVSVTRRSPRAAYLFTVPDWSENAEERQRLQLGMILRFAIRGSVGFYSIARVRKHQQHRYRIPVSHWEQQRYSGYQGRSAFGPPWLPISHQTEDLLFQLLRWPGSGISLEAKPISLIHEELKERLKTLNGKRGNATKLTFLEQRAPWPTKPSHNPTALTRPLRVGIVQCITPDFADYAARLSDPQLIADPVFRRRQRRHLAAVMQAVSQMLYVRETHRHQDRRDGRVLDLLAFPELAVHPRDIDPLLLPFVRKHKCITLFGMVYHPEPTLPGSPLINSCRWMIPEWTRTAGFQVRNVEQGKHYLISAENQFTPPPASFRPAQWLIEYQWSIDPTLPPLVMTASICYDATDLALAADLRNRSDFYIVCALNRDVGTFDRMAESLHYHMYQAIMVVNNGQFGGSNLFMPFDKPFHREVLHFHGQPQATIAFAEIDPLKLLNRPNPNHQGLPEGDWKQPPAGR